MGISKGMVVAAAVIAFGVVTVEDIAKGLISAPSFSEARAATTDDAVVQNGALRRRAAESLRVLLEQQASERGAQVSAASHKCREQSWPYYSGDCLVRRDGGRVAPVARVIGIDRLPPAPVQMAALR
jgi:hypothetical protein